MNQAATSLAKASGSQHVLPLIEHLRESDHATRNQVVFDLMAALPRLTEQSARDLEPRHWRILGELLEPAALLRVKSGSDSIVEFYVRVLEAAARFAPPETITAFTLLTVVEPNNPARIRAKMAATACVEAMEERLRQQVDEELLLRPAETPVDPLLHPIEGTADTDSGLLLRPHD
jgi:hypothetical protein